MLPSSGAASPSKGAICSNISTTKFAAHVAGGHKAVQQRFELHIISCSSMLWPLVSTSDVIFTTACCLFDASSLN